MSSVADPGFQKCPHGSGSRGVNTRDGCAFLWTFAFPRACIPRFFLRVPRSFTLFFSRSPVLLRSCFAFLCSCVNERMCGGGVQLITLTLYVYGRIRRAGSTRHRATHNPPSSCVRGVRVYWREAGLGSNSYLVFYPPFHLSYPPLPSHNCVNSSQEHEFSVPFLSRSTFLYKICVTARPRS